MYLDDMKMLIGFNSLSNIRISPNFASCVQLKRTLWVAEDLSYTKKRVKCGVLKAGKLPPGFFPGNMKEKN